VDELDEFINTLVDRPIVAKDYRVWFLYKADRDGRYHKLTWRSKLPSNAILLGKWDKVWNGFFNLEMWTIPSVRTEESRRARIRYRPGFRDYIKA
jgi:hypothetical protein